VGITPGTLTITVGAVDIVPEPVVITASPSTLAISIGLALDTPAVSVTPGGLTLTVGAAGITPEPVTVTVAPGTLLIYMPEGGALSTLFGVGHRNVIGSIDTPPTVGVIGLIVR
jgi:hypothetical protein